MEPLLRIRDIQRLIHEQELNAQLKQDYFLKLVEEIGSLANTLQAERDQLTGHYPFQGSGNAKQIDTDLAAILYYLLALADVYGIDLEESILRMISRNLSETTNQNTNLGFMTKIVESRDEKINVQEKSSPLTKEAFAERMKEAVQAVHGCSVSLIEEPQGFILYNQYGHSWGQVSIYERKLSINLELYPGRYQLHELARRLELPERRRGRESSFTFRTTEKTPPYFDSLDITLFQDYFSLENRERMENLLVLINEAAQHSDFKYRSTSR